MPTEDGGGDDLVRVPAERNKLVPRGPLHAGRAAGTVFGRARRSCTVGRSRFWQACPTAAMSAPVKACAGCGASECRLMKCARCHCVLYCTKECQVAAWPAHKAACRAAVAAAKAAEEAAEAAAAAASEPAALFAGAPAGAWRPGQPWEHAVVGPNGCPELYPGGPYWRDPDAVLRALEDKLPRCGLPFRKRQNLRELAQGVLTQADLDARHGGVRSLYTTLTGDSRLPREHIALWTSCGLDLTFSSDGGQRRAALGETRVWLHARI